jgi:hypothetical protein
MISRYLAGLLLISGGLFLIIKTELLMSWFGRIAWAEEKLGTEGGTRIFYKLIGMGSIVLAFMIMSGKIVSILDFVFKRG